MKVLFIYNLIPYPMNMGISISIRSTIEAISRVADLHLLIVTKPGDLPHRDEAVEYYRQFCKSVEVEVIDDMVAPVSTIGWVKEYVKGHAYGDWSQKGAELIRRRISEHSIDLLWAATTFLGRYLVVARQAGIKGVLSTQNVESELLRQRLWIDFKRGPIAFGKSLCNWLNMKALENRSAAMADAITAITPFDLNYYSRFKEPSALVHIPGCVEFEEAFDGSEETTSLCFVGAMRWAPNADAALFLVREIMPFVWRDIPDVRCYLVGKDPSPELLALSSENVVVTGTVPSVAPYLRQAALAVVPLRYGSGLKMKMPEAMGAGKAIVSTSIGAQGIPLSNGVHAVVVDDPQEFAREVVRLLNDPGTRRAMGCAARRFALEHYSIDSAAKAVGSILTKLSCA